MAINKVAIDGTPLIDLSTDTVASADDIALGKVGHLNDGSVVTGTHQGGSEPVIQSLSVTENGTYTAPEGVDGYSPVTVNTDPEKAFLLENYDSDGYPTTCRFVGNWINNSPLNDYFISGYAYGKMITEIEYPEGITEISDRYFSAIKKVTLPSSLNTHFNQFLRGWNKLEQVIYKGEVTGINAFWSDFTKAVLYDFSHHSGEIPTLSMSSYFGHASGCVIKVPQALLAEWQAATNWADLTDVVWQGV